jgi:ATP-dependent RNA helicase RhlE
MKGMMGVRVLIATPGRLIELVESGAVHLGQVRTLVLDEADKLLNMGFHDEMKAILDLLPKQRQSLLFSATLNPEIKDLQGAVLNHPERIEIEAKANTIDLITEQAYAISPENKGPFLRFLILKEEMQQVLIFTSSKRRADHVAEKLSKHGIQADSVHGDKSMGHRQKALSDFKAGKLRVLVTTDLLSRGIDIEFLPIVINYELPRSPKDYIHRIGRTGRAEHAGKAISIITPEEVAHFKVIQKKMKTWVELEDGDVLMGA